LNIAHGSPDYCGGILTIFGGPTSSTGTVFATPTWPTGLGTEPSCASTHQSWVAPGSPVPDAFAFISPPSSAGLPTGTSTTVLAGVDGCPTTTCREISYGIWSSGIPIGPSETVLVQPGTYYISGGNLLLKNNTCVRPTLQMGTPGCTYCTGQTLNWAGDG